MIYFVFTISAALAVVAIVEYWLHKRRLKVIPIRVLVNGTRGKSTVTRLIAAGLAGGGLRVCAKTTGSAARLILPDLTEEAICRRKSASIMEHARFVRRALGLGAQAIVAECMAIQPETIQTLERRLARSTIGVITNVRADHMDTMGAYIGQVAQTLALSMPERGKVFVGAEGLDKELREIFVRAGDRVATVPRFVSADDRVRSMCGRFGYPVFAENLALALAVCGECGVDQEAALRGMLKVRPDTGVCPSIQFVWRGITVRVVNAFAANDVQSTLEMWRAEAASAGGCDFRVLVFNHREDRAWRALQLGEIVEGMVADALLVYGMSERLARRTVRGYFRKKLQTEEKDTCNSLVIRAIYTTDASALLETIHNLASTDAADLTRIDILCAGNIKGPGLALTESFAAMSTKGAEGGYP